MIRQVVYGVAVLSVSLVIGCSPMGHHLSALKNSDVEVRREAALQVYKCSNYSKKTIAGILIAAEDSDPLVREYAIKAIAKLPPRTEGVSKVIRGALGDTNVNVRRTAVATFSYMNPVPAEILIPLAEVLGDKDSVLYSYVKSTFLDLGPLGVNALVHGCKSNNNELRCRAAATLGYIGCDAKRAIPVLKQMLNDKNDRVRDVAKSSIDKIQLSYMCKESKNGRKVSN